MLKHKLSSGAIATLVLAGLSGATLAAGEPPLALDPAEAWHTAPGWQREQAQLVSMEKKEAAGPVTLVFSPAEPWHTSLTWQRQQAAGERPELAKLKEAGGTAVLVFDPAEPWHTALTWQRQQAAR